MRENAICKNAKDNGRPNNTYLKHVFETNNQVSNRTINISKQCHSGDHAPPICLSRKLHSPCASLEYSSRPVSFGKTRRTAEPRPASCCPGIVPRPVQLGKKLPRLLLIGRTPPAICRSGEVLRREVVISDGLLQAGLRRFARVGQWEFTRGV